MLLKISDSSTLPLNLTNYGQIKACVKLHLQLVLWIETKKAVITTAKVHDRNQLEVLVDDKEAMYVFECGL